MKILENNNEWQFSSTHCYRAYSVTSKYSEYAVQFDGIGIGPPGNENVGCCSQMAIFYRKDMNTSPANPVVRYWILESLFGIEHSIVILWLKIVIEQIYYANKHMNHATY